MGRKKPRFHCKTEAQKKAIRANYAKIAQERKPQPSPQKPSFKLPLKNGGRRWNIYRTPNYILNGKQDGDVHGGLVLDELNDNVILVEVTHSKKDGKRNNLPVRNLQSKDFDEEGNLRKSYIKRRLIGTYKKNNSIEPIKSVVLKKQLNDLEFTEEEKQKILDELSNLSTAKEKYQLFERLSKEKSDT